MFVLQCSEALGTDGQTWEGKAGFSHALALPLMRRDVSPDFCLPSWAEF